MGLGIDLGTSFTAAAVATGGAIRLVELDYDRTISPSAVFVRDDGDLLFGQDAILAGSARPDRLLLDVKADVGRLEHYQIGERRVSVVDALAAGLRHVHEVARRRIPGLDRQSPVTITVPVGVMSQPDRLGAYRDAVERAGLDLERVEFLTEPSAAATGYWVEAAPGAPPEGDLALVYDLGGGTFDAAAVRLGRSVEPVGRPVGDDAIGGVRFDRAVLDAVLSTADASLRQAYRRPETEDGLAAWRGRMGLALRACREAKERLAFADEAPVTLPDGQTFVLTGDQLDRLLAPFIARTVDLLSQLSEEVGRDAGAPSAILMVGGSCRLAAVPKALSHAFDIPLLQPPDPARTVVIGAAAHAGRRRGEAPALADVARRSGERRSMFAAFATTSPRSGSEERTE